jgi:hypothetical protein
MASKDIALPVPPSNVHRLQSTGSLGYRGGYLVYLKAIETELGVKIPGSSSAADLVAEGYWQGASAAAVAGLLQRMWLIDR